MAAPMRFFSDNAARACPEALAAITEADRLDTAYDGDAWSARLDGALSELFETEVAALWVSTGTAANSLGLAAVCRRTAASCVIATRISRMTNAARPNSSPMARNCFSPRGRGEAQPRDGRGAARHGAE